jgi:hypothetical protein
MNTNTDKIRKVILDYFHFINPSNNNEVDIRTDSLKLMGLVLITIYYKEIKEVSDHFGSRGREQTLKERLEEDMGNMFPYCFQISYKRVKD